MTAAGGGILARGIPVAVKEAGEAACTVVIEWGYILYANYYILSIVLDDDGTNQEDES